MHAQQEWFEHWFDSPYYHILYQNRDDNEAVLFIDNLLDFLNPPHEAHILDLACGRGRHARYMAGKGFHVTGLDLAENSIDFANQFAHEKLQFHVHDMRQVFQPAAFDYIFNFFTSFGYFEHESDNHAVMESICAGLKPGGLVVIDFLNVNTVINNLAPAEIKNIDGIEFHISKRFENGRIIKSIRFEDKGKKFAFKEHLQAVTKTDFERYFSDNCLEIKHVFGDYNLAPFVPESSDRLILVAQKPA